MYIFDLSNINKYAVEDDKMIDFDNSATFPNEIKEWVLNQREYFYSLFDKVDFSEWWQLEHKLCDIRLWEQSFIQRFVDKNLKMEVAVWHTTRIEDKESYEKNGIIIMGGRGSKAERNLICLFQRVGMNEKQSGQSLKNRWPPKAL